MTDVVPLMPAVHELPPAVQSLRSDRERAFCWHYMFNGGVGAAAARSAGYSDASHGHCGVRAHILLQRDDVQMALNELSMKYLFSLRPKALARLHAVLDDPKNKNHVKAIEMTLNRTGLGERTTIDINARHTIVDHTQAAVEDLRKLKSLGVPREKLVEAFGYSGLMKYEKILASNEAKLIEGEVVKDG